MQSIGLVFKKEEMTAVCLRETINGVCLDGYRFLPFLDFKEEEKEGAILHNLERFFKKFRAGSYNLFIALPGDTALVKFLQLPMSVEENLGKTLGYEMDRYTPFSSEDVYYDYHVVKRIPESNLLFVSLLIIKKEVVEYYLNLLEKIKVKPRGIEITTTAVFNLFYKADIYKNSIPDTTGAKAGSSSLLYNKLLKFVRPEKKQKETPEASSEGVSFLVEYLNSSYELSMVSDGCLYYSKIFSCSTDASSDGHFREIYDNGMKALIHLPHSSFRGNNCRFVLSGREMDKSCLDYAPEDIRDAFSIMQNLPVKFNEKEDASIKSVLPLLCVPVGLALKGLTRVAMDVNFVPLRRRQKKKKSKKKMLAVAVAFCMIAFLVTYFVNNRRQMDLRYNVLNQQLQELKLQVQSIEGLQSDAERLEKLSGAIGKIKDSEISKIKLLEELTIVFPEDSWLTEFRYKAGERKVKLSGYAVSASKLIPILEESKLFENVKFTSPITTEKGRDRERFRLEMIVTKGGGK